LYKNIFHPQIFAKKGLHKAIIERKSAALNLEKSAKKFQAMHK
jgi:hypothetical protein